MLTKEALIAVALVALVTVGMSQTWDYDQVGIASWYGPGFHGQRTSSGEIYDMHEMTAAHKSLPFGTLVKVVDLETNNSVVVRITDRGPFIPGRIIDLSKRAAQELEIVDTGTARVGLKVLRWPSET
jgi:rare lipoprotein A